jgi:DNA-binding MarR family transcriptional regulator
MLDHKQGLFHLAGQLHRHLSVLQRDALQPLGLLPAQFSAIAEIALCEGMTQAELALRLDLEQPGVARTLAGLDEAGWIGRSTLKGRAQGLYLSDRSREILPRAHVAIAAAERAFLSGMTRTETAQLLDQLQQLSAGSAASRPSGLPRAAEHVPEVAGEADVQFVGNGV